MSAPVNVNQDNFKSDILDSELPVLVDFWAGWCAPCKAIAPVIENLSQQYDGKLKVAKIDITENEDIAMKYNIRSIPALLIFKNGEVVDQKVGALPLSQLQQFVDQNL